MVLLPNWEAFFAIIIPNSVAWICVFPTVGQIDNKDGTAWWQVIKKPSWALPAFSYGPMYAYMYTALGYASYLAYGSTDGFQDNLYAVMLYGAHLIITIISSTLFYKYHKLGYTFFLMLVLDGLMLGITLCFYQVNPYSLIFLVPIQVWQFYGSLFSHAVWVLNTKKEEDYQNLKV